MGALCSSLKITVFSSLFDVPDASFGVSHWFLLVLVSTLICEESISLWISPKFLEFFSRQPSSLKIPFFGSSWHHLRGCNWLKLGSARILIHDESKTYRVDQISSKNLFKVAISFENQYFGSFGCSWHLPSGCSWPILVSAVTLTHV